MPELMEANTVEAIRRRAKRENDDYICRGHILSCISNSLFDIYQNVESAKELWDSLDSKCMAEDASSERKSRKGQNRDETEQKREAWRNREKSKAVTVKRARKTEENAKRMAKNA
uniref:Zinc finger, CCHC-type n=1 Tax=Tanacetum cinerariifolium TaxID=118510 RepID=A0A6L2LA30_TANCI|nr:zinc finger, CCHC-type [Tanacetum cinerariifolium]